MPCNKADAGRSACLKGKKMAIKMKVEKTITPQLSFLKKHVYPLKQNKKMNIAIFL